MSAGSPPSDRWAIVGGGVLGMTLALRLVQNGRRVTLIEQSEFLGGLASAWQLGDVTWDRHYHVTLLSDTRTRALLGDLGLEKEMEWVQTRTGFFTDGRFHSMSSSLEFLRFPPLGLVSKVRLAATILYASRVKNWRRLEGIPVADWLRRWSGKRTFERIWLPLLRSKLGESYRDTSAAFIWATIARMYAARRTGLKKEMFGYVRGGYSRVLDVLRDRLVKEGVQLKLGKPVSRVGQKPGDGISVEVRGESIGPFEQAVLTVAAPVASRLCPDLNQHETGLLEDIRYQGIICASVLLRRPLAGYYVTNITESWVPFTAVIEMTALVDPRVFGGRTLVYLPKYLAADDPGFDLSDADVERRFTEGLLRMFPDLERSDILAFRVSRERYVHALSTLDYSRRLPPTRTSIPGIHIVNSAHIVNGTLNVNETIGLAESWLKTVLAVPDSSETAGAKSGRSQ